jgi:hypothetical protein
MVAHAVPITGSLNMVGNYSAVNSGWNTTTLDLATGLDFNPLGSANGTSPNMGITYAGGDFASSIMPANPLSPFPGTIKDIQFSPLGSRSGAGPVTDFWTAGGFSFALTGIIIESQSSTQLALYGTGIVSGNGFTNTLGSWRLSAQTLAGGANASVFSWSSTGKASGVAVAEPGALALLGIGLVAIGAVRGRQILRG